MGCRNGSSTEGGAGRKSVDQVLSVLQNNQRREVLRTLREANNRTMTVSDLVDLMIERERGVTSTEQLKLLLHHVHLPKLANERLIEYDFRSGMLRYHGSDDVERLLDRIEKWNSEI